MQIDTYTGSYLPTHARTESLSCIKRHNRILNGKIERESERVYHTNRILAKRVLALILFSLSFTHPLVCGCQISSTHSDTERERKKERHSAIRHKMKMSAIFQLKCDRSGEHRAVLYHSQSSPSCLVLCTDDDNERVSERARERKREKERAIVCGAYCIYTH